MHVYVNAELGKVILEVDSRQIVLTPAQANEIGQKLLDCAEVAEPSARVSRQDEPHDPSPIESGNGKPPKRGKKA